jgi:hypothetical protein
MAWRLFGGRRKQAHEFTAMQELLSRSAPSKRKMAPVPERPEVRRPARKPPMNVFEARRIGMRILDGTEMGGHQRNQIKGRILSANSPEEVDRIVAEMGELAKRKRT